MCSTKFIIFASFGLCLLASTVFGQFDGQQPQPQGGFGGGQMGGQGGFGGFGGGRGGFGGGRHGGGPFGGLSSNLTQEQRQQLKDIMRNDNVTKQQQQDSLRSFFEGIGGDALTRFNEMQTQMEAHKAQFSNFSANANLSDAAKNLLTQVQAVKDNMQITKAQEHQQIEALFDGASAEVKQELKSLKHGGGRGGFGGGRPGGFGGQQGGFGGGFGGQQGGFGGGFGGQQGGFGSPRFGGQGFGGQGFGNQQGGFGGQGQGFGQQGGFGQGGFGQQGFGGQGFGGQQGGFGGQGQGFGGQGFGQQGFGGQQQGFGGFGRPQSSSPSSNQVV